MLRLVDSVLRTAALVLFAAFLVTALPKALRRSIERTASAVSWAAETPEAARRRVLGPEVAAAYDRLRSAIPSDGAYLLVDGGTLGQGSPYWVRYQLAPRKAVLAGDLGHLPSAEEVLRHWPPGIRYAVVALPEGAPPVLMERGDLITTLVRVHAAR